VAEYKVALKIYPGQKRVKQLLNDAKKAKSSLAVLSVGNDEQRKRLP
jgi:hypothetical protein